MWSSRPSAIVIAASIADILIIPIFAVSGVFMAPLPLPMVLAVFASALVLALVLDAVKAVPFGQLRMAE
jgi:H+-transporting ATPase